MPVRALADGQADGGEMSTIITVQRRSAARKAKQVDAAWRPGAASAVRVAVPRVGSVRRGTDGCRPRSFAPQPGTPGGRPAQPGTPMAGASCTLSTAVRTRAAARGRGEVGQLQLTDGWLLAVMISFLLAAALGTIVVVNQYLALGAVV